MSLDRSKAAAIIKFPRSSKLSRRNRGRNKPSDPVEIARIAAEQRRDPGKWGLNHEALGLKANEAVTVEGNTQANTERARRYDVFSLMFFHPKSRLSPASYDAVRRLQADLAVLHRTEGASDAIRTSSPGGGWITEHFSISRVQAGDRISLALEGCPRCHDHPSGLPGILEPWRRTLIRALCEHEVIRGSAPNWHQIVLQKTGERDKNKRLDYVRECCDALAESYRTIDNQPRRAVG